MQDYKKTSRKDVVVPTAITVSCFFKEFFKLFKETFRPRALQSYLKSSQEVLQFRAILSHGLCTLLRFVLYLSGAPTWLKALEERHEREELNHELLDGIEEYLRAGILCHIFVGLFLTLLCAKFRNLAWVLLYYELILQCAYAIVPYDLGDQGSWIRLL